MTNLELLKLPEGEFKITNDIHIHTLKVIQHPEKKKKHLLFVLKPRFSNERITLLPSEEDFYTKTRIVISDFFYENEKDLSKYRILTES